MMYVYVGPEADLPHTTLELTDKDLLWLGRAYVGEHGWHDVSHFGAFTWCMINRYMLHPGSKHWPTFVYMLRRFSQPINPRWQRDGDLAKKHAGSSACTEAKFRRRKLISTLKWVDLPAVLRSRLRMLQAGCIAPVDGLPERRNRVSNFAATTARMKRRYPHGINIGGNWYFEGRGLKRGVIVVDHWSR
jgi:hypothetical protein